MNIPKHLLPKKDDDRLPDSYKISFFFHGEKEAREVEVVWHRLLDKVYDSIQVEQKQADGTVKKVWINNLIGIAPVPFFEYKTVKGIEGLIPFASIKEVVFDENWSTIVAIGKEKEKKANEAK